MHLRPTPVLPLMSAAALLAAVLISCSVTFTDDVKYSCTQDSDCGGDGFTCARSPTRSVCCKPTGPEVCDKVDNDCDGFVDNTGKQETCNGVDDDCNDRIDDGFDLRTNSNHCGECNKACPGTQYCKASVCTIRLESQCFDNFDDDGNGLTDCDDPSCDARACGASCVCSNLKRAEDRCDDNVNNDVQADGGGDSLVDCFDPDCTGKSCRAGCTCAPDAGQIETDCTDGQDNDLDSRADCLDDDCIDQFCTPPDIYFRCTAMQTCRCNGGVQVSEVGSVLCRDGIDNDCDGQIDCDEASCIGQSCSPDAGPVACECSGTGSKKEVGCANLTDDDGDTLVDCADSDCNQGTACAKPDGGMGTCTTTSTCD